MAAKAKYSGPLEKGREICCYRIEEPLGSGGMGKVCKARHGMLNRAAAIKMIRPAALGTDQASRYIGALSVGEDARRARERRALAATWQRPSRLP